MDARNPDTSLGLRLARFAGEALCETLWPTRCALCDRPGDVLCLRCEASLPYNDYWRACPRCGSPYGARQCDFCNPVMMQRIGLAELPFEGCASATRFDAETGQLVRLFKDRGEQRLAAVLGRLMVQVLPPGWPLGAVAYVPASRAAVRRRGFDHGELLGREVAARAGLECRALLRRPRTRDQRGLSARGRIANLADRFEAAGAVPRRGAVLLVDDVMTTGATLCSAASALSSAGCPVLYGLTFARV